MITYIASPLTLKYGVAVKRTYQLARLSEKSAKELLNWSTTAASFKLSTKKKIVIKEV